MKFKKIAAIALSMSMLLSSVGCSKSEVKTQEDKNQIAFGTTKDLDDINPHLYSGDMAPQNMIFEGLVEVTHDGIQPKLATEWEISDNGLEYTFHLRDDVTFTDGEKFNADVVKLNFDAIISNIERHSWLDLINLIDSTEVVDEYTFKLNLTHAYYPTLTEIGLTRPFRFISPKCFIDGETKNGVDGYIGTGPWVLSEHKVGQYALFEANENYYGEKAKTDSIKWNVMPDHQTIILALQKGEIDLVFGSDGDMVDADTFAAMKDKGEFDTAISHPIASRAILLNSAQDITKEKEVRLALQYAVNKDEIVNGVLNGSEIAADTLMDKSVPYCDLDLEVRDYDIDKANELLDKANWKISDDGYRYKDGKKLSLDISYNVQKAQEAKISTYLQNDFKAIGVELNIMGEEQQSFADRQKSGEFDLQYSLSCGPPYDPQSYVSSFRTPAHGDYQAQVGLEKKKWLDETITNLMIEVDEDKRAQMYSDVFSYIHDEGVYIPLSYSKTTAIHSKELKGVEFNLSQYEIPFEKMYFEK